MSILNVLHCIIHCNIHGIQESREQTPGHEQINISRALIALNTRTNVVVFVCQINRENRFVVSLCRRQGTVYIWEIKSGWGESYRLHAPPTSLSAAFKEFKWEYETGTRRERSNCEGPRGCVPKISTRAPLLRGSRYGVPRTWYFPFACNIYPEVKPMCMTKEISVYYRFLINSYFLLLRKLKLIAMIKTSEFSWIKVSWIQFFV